MDSFPAFLRLDARPVLLVGAGAVAARKARLLLAAGAALTIVAPRAGEGIEALAAAGRVRLLRRRFRPDDVGGHWLVVHATNSQAVGRAVKAAADAARVFCNSVDDVDSCSYITPAIVDRGALVVAISSGGKAPVLARQLRSRIEALLPARLGELVALAGRWRRRVAATLTSMRDRLHFWERFFDGRVQQRLDALGADAAERFTAELLDAAAQSDDTDGAGMAWLVGAGPGDPDLLTLKALRAMQQADVILHDRLVSDAVLELARRDAERLSVGKTPGCTANTQEQTNALLVQLVAAGKRVCRLKGGDPFIFGRGGEEADALRAAGLPFEVVPGITAAAGCAAAAGIPLTHRDAAQSVVLLTGHGKHSIDTLDWPSLARDRQTLAVYMGVRRFTELMQNLTRHGRSAETPIAIIERGTTPEQRVIRGTLGQLPMLAEAHRVRSPAMLLIGEVTRIGTATATANGAAAVAEDDLAHRSAIQSA